MNLVQVSLCAGIGAGVTKSVSPAYNCLLFIKVLGFSCDFIFCVFKY